jgi:hypothetical protein
MAQELYMLLCINSYTRIVDVSRKPVVLFRRAAVRCFMINSLFRHSRYERLYNRVKRKPINARFSRYLSNLDAVGQEGSVDDTVCFRRGPESAAGGGPDHGGGDEGVDALAFLFNDHVL